MNATHNLSQPIRARGWPFVGLGFVALIALCAPGCQSSSGHFCLFGYSPKPMYDTNIHTVYVPIFKNVTLRDTTRQGVEYDLTRMVIQQIESKTPYKVVSNKDCADTELIGTIVNINKGLTNINPNNEIRQAETLMTVNIVWKDLRTGEILSAPARRINNPLYTTPALPAPKAIPGVIESVPIDPNAPPLTSPVEPVDVAPVVPPTPPAVVQSTDSYAPELGQSTRSALMGNMERIAVQIVSMMEAPW